MNNSTISLSLTKGVLVIKADIEALQTISPAQLIEWANQAQLDGEVVRDTWRERMADGDEVELKRLLRFKSPRDVWKSYRSMEKMWKQRNNKNKK